MASRGVTVHVASPGYIETNLSNAALSGDGQAYNQRLDSSNTTQAAAAHPDQVAVQILEGVARGKMDFTVAAGFLATLAIFWRRLCPPLLWALLVRLYRRSVMQ